LLLLHPGPHGPELLFTRRTQDVLTHKGQISFPGGSQDPGDADLLATALRETQEEVGIPAEAIEILGELDDTLTAASYFLVTPFVGLYRGGLDALRPEPREVAQVLSVPLAALRDPRILREESFEVDGRPQPVYFYQHGPDVIWGATARILHGLLERLG
jgi:8-oxo-dGTP pyrophosphatase MutT (NUDIX family)